MSELFSASTLSRRRLLQLGGLTAVASVIGPDSDPIAGAYKDHIQELWEAARPFFPAKHVPRPPLQREQVFASSNPRINRPLNTDTEHAFVVVHPDYALTHAARYLGEFNNRKRPPKTWEQQYDIDEITSLTDLLRGKEGSYGVYQERLSRLYEHLHQTDTPVIVFQEGNRVYSDRQPAGRETPNKAFTVTTINDDPEPQPNVTFKDGGRFVTEKQNVNLLYGTLATSGITKIIMAGEYGLSRGGGIYPACVGTVAVNFLEQGFEVQGLEGAVFPTQPLDYSYKQSTVPINQSAADALYNNVAQLP